MAAALKLTVCLCRDDGDFVAAISLPSKYLQRSVARAVVGPVLKSCAGKRGRAPAPEEVDVVVCGRVVSPEDRVDAVAWGEPAAATLRPRRAAPAAESVDKAVVVANDGSPYDWCLRAIREHVIGDGGAEAFAWAVREAFTREPWYRPTATGKNESARAVHLVIARTCVLVVARETAGRETRLGKRLIDLAVRLAVAGIVEYWLPFRLRDELGLSDAPIAGPTAAADSALRVCDGSRLEGLASRAADRLAIDGLFIDDGDLVPRALAAKFFDEASRLRGERKFSRAEVKDARGEPYVDVERRGDLVWWLDGADQRGLLFFCPNRAWKSPKSVPSFSVGADAKTPLLSALAHLLRDFGARVGPKLAGAPRPGADPVAEETRRDALARAAASVGDADSPMEVPTHTLPHAMLSCYPGGGARFRAHVDNEGSDLRVLTCVYYLNKDWPDDAGGALRLYRPGAKRVGLDVKPELGKLVLFWSRLVEHEVMPAFRDRWAISMWYSEPQKGLTAPKS